MLLMTESGPVSQWSIYPFQFRWERVLAQRPRDTYYIEFGKDQVRYTISMAYILGPKSVPGSMSISAFGILDTF
jgi:hypothetical protein